MRSFSLSLFFYRLNAYFGSPFVKIIYKPHGLDVWVRQRHTQRGIYKKNERKKKKENIYAKNFNEIE